MSLLDDAATAWREGRLLDARAAYGAALQADPASWAAAFQLAWLDSAFGGPTRAQVQALERDDLSPSARGLVDALADMARQPTSLPGRIEDWDIDALLRQGSTEHYGSWWESRGKTAAGVGLYGLALACFEEAERREPGGAFWDPPAWSHSLPAQVESHLALVAHPFAG